MWHKALLMGYSMRLELTLVSSLNNLWLVRQVYIGVILPLSKSVLHWSAFIPIWYVYSCVCMCTRTGIGVILGFTNSFFFFCVCVCVCVCVCLGEFLCVGLCGFKFTGTSFFFFSICIHMFLYVCVCVFSLILSPDNMSGIRSG